VQHYPSDILTFSRNTFEGLSIHEDLGSAVDPNFKSTVKPRNFRVSSLSLDLFAATQTTCNEIVEKEHIDAGDRDQQHFFRKSKTMSVGAYFFALAPPQLMRLVGTHEELPYVKLRQHLHMIEEAATTAQRMKSLLRVGGDGTAGLEVRFVLWTNRAVWTHFEAGPDTKVPSPPPPPPCYLHPPFGNVVN
jgi:hypothetical protein